MYIAYGEVKMSKIYLFILMGRKNICFWLIELPVLCKLCFRLGGLYDSNKINLIKSCHVATKFRFLEVWHKCTVRLGYLRLFFNGRPHSVSFPTALIFSYIITRQQAHHIKIPNTSRLFRPLHERKSFLWIFIVHVFQK